MSAIPEGGVTVRGVKKGARATRLAPQSIVATRGIHVELFTTCIVLVRVYTSLGIPLQRYVDMHADM